MRLMMMRTVATMAAIAMVADLFGTTSPLGVLGFQVSQVVTSATGRRLSQDHKALHGPQTSARTTSAWVPTSTHRLATRLSATKKKASSLARSSSFAKYDDVCDVLVLGSGPAARAIASLLASSSNSLDVLLSDKNVDREWPPNYGVWQEEWDAIVERYAALGVSLEGGSNEAASIDRIWPVTDCYFGGSFNIPTEQRMRLDRPYCRVDRFSLRNALTPGPNNANGNAAYRILKANHFSTAVNVNLYSPAGSLLHDAEGTTIQLKTADESIVTVRTKLVIDCTGHETKLVLREPRGNSLPPGFQIAYGALVEIDESNSPDLSFIGPYDKQAMTLFDYRTDHFEEYDANVQRQVATAPTFMYAMPLFDNYIFFEETSLVARPAMSFADCKNRCAQRLAYHGIRVSRVLEEEFCYIPMGGVLPAKDQRVVGLGGSAVMVHPSTGFHLCRVLMGAADVAETIHRTMVMEQPPASMDQVAASVYHALWTPANIRQRNFAVFGGEFLMKQTVVGLRGFFDGFFRLPVELWGGFLAGWPGLPYNVNHETWFGRMWFGLTFVVKLPPVVAFDMLFSILQYSIQQGTPLLQSVTPFFGQPESYEYRRNDDIVGDLAAKQEARVMIQASAVTEELPVAFDSSAGTMPVGENGAAPFLFFAAAPPVAAEVVIPSPSLQPVSVSVPEPEQLMPEAELSMPMPEAEPSTPMPEATEPMPETAEPSMAEAISEPSVPIPEETEPEFSVADLYKVAAFVTAATAAEKEVEAEKSESIPVPVEAEASVQPETTEIASPVVTEPVADAAQPVNDVVEVEKPAEAVEVEAAMSEPIIPAPVAETMEETTSPVEEAVESKIPEVESAAESSTEAESPTPAAASAVPPEVEESIEVVPDVGPKPTPKRAVEIPPRDPVREEQVARSLLEARLRMAVQRAPVADDATSTAASVEAEPEPMPLDPVAAATEPAVAGEPEEVVNVDPAVPETVASMPEPETTLDSSSNADSLTPPMPTSDAVVSEQQQEPVVQQPLWEIPVEEVAPEATPATNTDNSFEPMPMPPQRPDDNTETTIPEPTQMEESKPNPMRQQPVIEPNRLPTSKGARSNGKSKGFGKNN